MRPNSHSFGNSSIARQSDAHDADINHIMRRVSGAPSSEPMFGDSVGMPRNFAEVFAFHERVVDSFRQLPSEVRLKFKNNPEELVRFVADPANRPEALKLGLLTPSQAEVDEEVELNLQREASAKIRREKRAERDLKKQAAADAVVD